MTGLDRREAILDALCVRRHGQLGFLVVKQSEFHINSSIDFDWGYYPV